MKLSTAEKESSWRLLFDIALSHGASLQYQQLTYSGFLTFAESAALVGPSTGVFPALLEELWKRHCESWSDTVERMGRREASAGGTLLASRTTEANTAAFHEEAREHGVVNFDGFADIMNVISVRCFQTHSCSSLMVGDAQQSLRDAILLSAEARVRLVDCVAYTAAEYLKEFVHRNTVHRQTVIRLDPALNGWTPHVKALVTHLVGSLHKTLLLPLFRRFAPTGQMNRTEYVNFLRAVLPTFNPIEEASALAIFDYREFSHPSVYIQPLDQLMSTAPEGGPPASATLSLLDVHEASSSARGASSERPRTIGFDAFVDAVLMLGVVVYADERMWPHHRCITAKLWSILEDHLCRAVPGAVMAVDPLFTSTISTGTAAVTTPQASVSPVLSLIYPARLPIDRLAVVLLGGLNLTVPEDADNNNNNNTATGPSAHRQDAPNTAAVDDAPRRHGSTASSAVSEVPSSLSSRPVKPPQKAQPPPAAASPTLSAAAHQPQEDDEQAASAAATPAVLSVAQAAAALFNTTFEKKMYTAFDTPVYAELRCHTYVNEELAAAEMLCPNLAAMHLPRSFWNTTTFRSYVTFTQTPGKHGGGSLLFTPFRRVTVSLRHEDGVRVYAAMELILEASPTRQPLSDKVVSALEAVFERHSQASTSQGGRRVVDDWDVQNPDDTDDEDGGAQGVPRTISTRAFVDICRELHLVSAATASLHCQAAIQTYWKLFDESRVRDSTDVVTAGTTSSLPTSLSFPQFICCVAHVCMRQANVASAASLDILQYLSVALSASSSAPPSLSPGGNVAPLGGVAGAVLPHNGLREVPYQQTMALRRRAAAESGGRRDELLETLRDVRSLEADRQQQTSSALALVVDDAVLARELAGASAKEPMLPAFPSMQMASAPTNGMGTLVPLYASDFTRDDASHGLAARLQHDFLRDEVVIKYP